MAFEFLISYAALYICDKLVAKAGWKFYWAALLYIGIVTSVRLFTPALAGVLMGSHLQLDLAGLNYVSLVAQFVVAAITLKLLDYYEDTIVVWLMIFVAGWGILQLI